MSVPSKSMKVHGHKFCGQTSLPLWLQLSAPILTHRVLTAPLEQLVFDCGQPFDVDYTAVLGKLANDSSVNDSVVQCSTFVLSLHRDWLANSLKNP